MANTGLIKKQKTMKVKPRALTPEENLKEAPSETNKFIETGAPKDVLVVDTVSEDSNQTLSKRAEKTA